MATVLVIDDDKQSREVIRDILESDGYEVVEAKDGKEGVAVFRKQPTDLVVTDIIMPEQEGVETILQLKRDYPDVKIIAVSGGGRLSPTDYLHIAKKSGAKQTLQKPFRVEELLTAARKLLSDGV